MRSITAASAAVVACLIGALAPVGPASAAIPSMTGYVSGLTTYVQGTANSDAVTVRNPVAKGAPIQVNGSSSLRNQLSGIVAGPGCVQLSYSSITCGKGLSKISLNLLGGADALVGDAVQSDDFKSPRVFAYGGDGNDVLSGSGANDMLDGGGNDKRHMSAFTDTLLGWGGNDKLVGGPGDNERLAGDDGNDTIVDTEGIGTSVNGFAGNDRIIVSDPAVPALPAGLQFDDQVRCDDGRDFVKYDPFDYVDPSCEQARIPAGR